MKTAITYSLLLSTLIVSQAWSLPITGRVDTFSDGTTQGWRGTYPGYTPLPSNITTGGPSGPNDAYLEISTNGFHLASFNDSRAWTGDYLSVGVKAIRMDLLLLHSNTNIRLSLALIGPGGMFAVKERTPPLHDPNQWHTHTFNLSPQDVVHVANGTGIYQDTLQNVTKILLRHDGPTPSRPGTHPPHVVAAVGIDNVTAILHDYHVGWTFGNQDASAYTLQDIEPKHFKLGNLNQNNPELTLIIGQRYQVTVTNPQAHPLELIAKNNNPNSDTIILSQKPNVTSSWETDKNIDWYEQANGTVTFTLTPALAEALQGNTDQQPGYRCALHRQSMRGDIKIVE